MHSKFLKFQTVFLTLAVLFTSVLVPNQVQALERGSASNAAQTAAITDPNTFNAWYEIQGNNTAATGRIWADKTVDADPIQFTAGPLKGKSVEKADGSDFLVALSAMSSTSSTTQTEPIPLDVVMVLDASGSMSDPMGRTDATKRIDALKAAVSKFIEKAATKNAQISDESKKIRLSIVKFAGDTSTYTGNDTYRDGGYTYNYSQIMQNLTVCEGTGAQQLKNTVKAIKPAGATQADYGLERAQAALASNPDQARSNTKKVVIFFTDGSPTSSSGFESDVASLAIGTAKTIKAKGTEVYTVGIFEGAKPSASVTDSDTSRENKFMHAVSSNYPNATYTPGLWNYTFNWGTAAANRNYYLAATSADGLNSVFEGIFRSVATNLTGPTLIEKNRDPSSDGYVTFDDTLGSFMEVKGFNGIALADRIYTNIEKTTNGNVDTYECTDQVTGPVSPAYPQHADLRKVLITVTHSDDRKTGDSVRVRIPASMLPLRHFDLQRDAGGNVTSLNVTDTYPIRVLYSVGLKDEVRGDLEAGTSTDPDLVQYVAANAVDGEIHFYSNAYTGKKNSEGITIGDTTASFVPALNNSFYYYTQDTPLYMDKDCTKPVTNFQQGQTYYYKLEYYSNQAGKTTPTYGFSAIPISISADQDGSVIGQNASGQAYVKKGTKKGSMPRAIDDQIGNKSENITETATRRIDYDWNLKNGMGYLHLGNNGRLGYEAKGSLKITKQVQAAVGLTPADDTAFTMQVNLTDSAGTALPGSYSYTVDGTAAGSIANGGTIPLKQGQTAEIEGLPAGSKYTVTEVNIPAGYTADISDSGNGVITAGRVNDTAPVVTVTNTYAPAAYPMENAFPGSKTLNGRNWKDGDSYRFLLEAINPTDAPLPATVETDAAGTRYSQVDVKAEDGTPAGKPIDFNFGTVTFTEPGKYVYNIREYTPSTEDRIPGVSYDETVYRATVGITDNGQGQLALGSYTLEEIVQENGTTNAPNGNVAAFTNTFNANDEVINFKALKRYVDNSGATRLANGQFHFTLERATTDDRNQPVTTQAPMPSPEGCKPTNTAGGEITFGNITYGTADIGKTYWYTIKEEHGNEPNMVYSNAEYLAKVDVTLKGTDTYAGISYYVKQADGSWKSLEGSGDNTPVVFENTYTPTAASATLQLTKDLKGRGWKDNDSFTFTLTGEKNAPMPAGDATVTVMGSTEGLHKAAFGAITYSQVGTYNYTITEQATKIRGVSIDEPVTATVTVRYENGALKADVAYSRGTDSAAFTNAYTAAPYEVSASALFKVSKTLTGRDWTDSDVFEFTLSGEGNAPLPPINQRKAAVTRGSTTTTFGDKVLTFNAAGEYVYYITEEPGSIAGVTYDTTKYKVVVSVTDDGTGALTGTTRYYQVVDGVPAPVEGTVAAFTNTYTAASYTAPASALFHVSKTLTGRDWTDNDTFEFTLTGEGNAPLPPIEQCTAAVTRDSTTTTFGDTDLTFNAAGDYVYYITEEPGSIAGVTYDTTKYKVVVSVTDNGTGTLTGTTRYYRVVNGVPAPVEGTVAAFTNAYTAAPTDVTLTAHKTLKVESGSWALQGNDFSFALYDNADCTGTPLRTATNTADGSITFEALPFDAAGAYTYYMREIPGDRTAITYDSTVYKVTITVQDNGTGALTALPPVYTLDGEARDAAEFVNTYTATPGDDTFTLTINKLLNGRAMNAGEFSFELTDNTGAVVSTGTNAADGTVTFSPVGLKAAQEQYSAFLASLPAAVEPEATATPEPTATPDATAVPEATPEATAEPEPTATPEVTAQPEATAEPDPTAAPETTPAPEASALPQADGMAAAPMSLVVAPLAAGTQEIQPDFGPDDGIAPNLLQRWYTITEVNTGKTGVTYDSTVYKVLVPLKDSGDGSGTLVVDDEHIQYYRVVDGELAPVEGVTFTNRYAPLSTRVTLGGTKMLNGRALAADEFTFELCSADGTKVLSTATNQADGRFSFDPIDFTHEGTYTYKVREKNTGAARVTYDQTVYTVTVKVVDKDGQLTAEVALPDSGLTFTNSYAPLPTSVTLEGSKKLNGRALAADEFTFELCSADGTKVLSTATNQADGRFSFDPIDFTHEGTYTYKVREKNTGAARVTYDQTVYTVTVKVVDKDGQLTAEVALPDSGLTFTNTYTPKPDHKDKPKQTPAPTSTAQPAAPTQSPRTGDNASLMTWVGLLLVCGTALAGLYVYKKRKQK